MFTGPYLLSGLALNLQKFDRPRLHQTGVGFRLGTSQLLANMEEGEPLHGWEIFANPLIEHGRFYTQLGEKT